MAERIISERIVSERVIKGGGLFAPITNRFTNLASAIGGLCIAPIVILAALGILVYSERFGRSSELIEKLELISAESATGKSGMQKIEGTPIVDNPVTAPGIGKVLYFTSIEEEYREVKETRRETVTKEKDGQQVEQVIEKEVLVEKWVNLGKDKEEWATFKLGQIIINPTNADLKANLEKKILKIDTDGEFLVSSENAAAQIGDKRITVEYLESNDELIVVGEIRNDKISSGEEFLVSNYDDGELISNLKSSENSQYWGLKIFAFLMTFIGITMMLQPIVALADFIPFVGKAAGMVAGAISFVLALIFVVLVSILVKFWWLVLILGILLVVGLMAILGLIISRKKEKTV